jgi:hypothetical protein
VPVAIFIYRATELRINWLFTVFAFVDVLILPLALMNSLASLAIVCVNDDGISRSIFGFRLQYMIWSHVRLIRRSLAYGAGEAIDVVAKEGCRADGPPGWRGSQMTFMQLADSGRFNALLTRIAKEKNIPLASKYPLKRSLSAEEYRLLNGDGLPIEWL